MEPSDEILAQVNAVSEEARAAAADEEQKPSKSVQQVREDARRAEALTLRMAGIPYSQIADRLQISQTAARNLVVRSLEHANQAAIEELRGVENQRLDRAQAAIWPQVIQGDHKAIQSFLRISQERSKINGIYAPQKLDLAVNVRNEMMRALEGLDELADNIIDAEVIEDDLSDPSTDIERYQ